MPNSFRYPFYFAALAAMAVGLYLTRLWGAERQVQLHSEHLIQALEGRSWERFSSLIADSYTDQWKQDRTVVLQRSRAIFGYIRGIQIVPSDVNIRAGGRSGSWRAKIAVAGAENSELAMLVKDRVNRLPSPFVLEWRQVSGKPWDWKLVSVANESLDLPEASSGFP